MLYSERKAATYYKDTHLYQHQQSHPIPIPPPASSSTDSHIYPRAPTTMLASPPVSASSLSDSDEVTCAGSPPDDAIWWPQSQLAPQTIQYTTNATYNPSAYPYTTSFPRTTTAELDYSPAPAEYFAGAGTGDVVTDYMSQPATNFQPWLVSAGLQRTASSTSLPRSLHHRTSMDQFNKYMTNYDEPAVNNALLSGPQPQPAMQSPGPFYPFQNDPLPSPSMYTEIAASKNAYFADGPRSWGSVSSTNTALSAMSSSTAAISIPNSSFHTRARYDMAQSFGGNDIEQHNPQSYSDFHFIYEGGQPQSQAGTMGISPASVFTSDAETMELDAESAAPITPIEEDKELEDDRDMPDDNVVFEADAEAPELDDEEDDDDDDDFAEEDEGDDDDEWTPTTSTRRSTSTSRPSNKIHIPPPSPASPSVTTASLTVSNKRTTRSSARRPSRSDQPERLQQSVIRFPRSTNSLTLPSAVPHLTKRSRGRQVPTVLAPEDAKYGGRGQVETSVKIDPVTGRPRGYVCKVKGCGKCFQRGEHLKRHVRSIHTNEKPHKCLHPGCGKDFSRRDNLLQHTSIHSRYSR